MRLVGEIKYLNPINECVGHMRQAKEYQVVRICNWSASILFLIVAMDGCRGRLAVQ